MGIFVGFEILFWGGLKVGQRRVEDDVRVVKGLMIC